MFLDPHKAVPHDPLATFLEPGLPLYGLGSQFSGTRALGKGIFQKSVERSHGKVTRTGEWWLGLLHLEPIDQTGVWVEVATVTPGYSPQEPIQVFYEAALQRPTGKLDASNGHPMHKTILMDGSAHEFHGWAGIRGWAASTKFESHTLIVVAFNFSPEAVTIVTVRDLTPYVEGRRVMIQNSRTARGIG